MILSLKISLYVQIVGDFWTFQRSSKRNSKSCLIAAETVEVVLLPKKLIQSLMLHVLLENNAYMYRKHFSCLQALRKHDCSDMHKPYCKVYAIASNTLI